MQQRFQAVHLRHLDIQGDDVGEQFADALQGDEAIRGASHDFDVRVFFEHPRDQAPYDDGIVDDHHPNLPVDAGMAADASAHRALHHDALVRDMECLQLFKNDGFGEWFGHIVVESEMEGNSGAPVLHLDYLEPGTDENA